MKGIGLALPLALLCSLGCTGSTGTFDTGDDTDLTDPPYKPDQDQGEDGTTMPGNACLADALASDVAISADLDALAARWDKNDDLVRVLFIGEPG